MQKLRYIDLIFVSNKRIYYLATNGHFDCFLRRRAKYTHKNNCPQDTYTKDVWIVYYMIWSLLGSNF